MQKEKYVLFQLALNESKWEASYRKRALSLGEAKDQRFPKIILSESLLPPREMVSKGAHLGLQEKMTGSILKVVLSLLLTLKAQLIYISSQASLVLISNRRHQESYGQPSSMQHCDP